MKNLALLMLLSIIFVRCSAGKVVKINPEAMKTTNTTYLPTAELHNQNGREMLIGNVAYDDILHYFEIWRTEDAGIVLDQPLIDRIKAIKEPIDVVCYLGTWCEDSRSGVPPFVRAIREANNPNIQLTLIAINRDKTEPESLLENGIERVPTFILKQNDEEFARLVEFPMQENFVLDFVEIAGT